MSEIAALLDRIRTHLFLHGDHPQDWFIDFDKLRSGKVTEQQFHRCLEVIKFPLTESEFSLMINRYGDQGRINYRMFCDEVEDIFSNKALEKNPRASLIDPHSIVSKTLGNDESMLDEKLLNLLNLLAYQMKTRSIHIREAFMDFDPHNNGHVTQAQFLRSLPFINLSPEDIKLLLSRYTDPAIKDVNYRRLNTDLNSIINTGHVSTNPTQQISTVISSEADEIDQSGSDDIIGKFARHVQEQRIRIQDFFHSHDPLNKGIITPSKFEGTLTLFGFSFTVGDIAYLKNIYKKTEAFSDYVRYKDFCTDVENSRGQISSATLRTRSLTIETPEIGQLMDKIRHTVVRYRINVLPTLQTFDRQKRGFITENQFHRALSTLKILVSVPELKLLSDKYATESGLDYFSFVEDVDPSHQQHRREFRPIGADKSSIESTYGKTPSGDLFITPDKADELIYRSKRGLISKIDEKTDIESLIFEMKKWSIINGVDFTDFLQDFDKLRCGEIPVSQFRSGLSMSTYKLTESEFDLIVDTYSSSSRKGYIRWKVFTDEILAAIAPKELEKSPKITPPDPKQTFTQVLPRDISGIMPSDIETIVEIISRFIKSRRISLLEQFKDKDRLNHKLVTTTAFAQVMQLIGVHISKDEIDKLCMFYNDPKSNFIDYHRFVDDVNMKTGEIFGGNSSTGIVVNPIPSYGNDDSPYLVSVKSTSGIVEDWNQICSRLQTFVYKRQVRLTDFFSAFDQLRKGVVTKQKFHSVVGQTNLPLTSSQIETVIHQFPVQGTDDMFDYRSFCAEVNKVFGITDSLRIPVLENDLKVDPLPDPSSTIQQLSEQEERVHGQIITRMRKDVITKRMNIQEQFIDYDKKPRKNYITKQQFKQCIARLGLTTDPKEFDILCKKYRCTMLDDMNYHAFCNDIETMK